MSVMFTVGVHNTEYHVDEEVSLSSLPTTPARPPLPDDVEESPSPQPQTLSGGPKKPQRRRTLSSKASMGLPSIGSREDLAAMESAQAPASAAINGRMAVSRIVGPEAYYMGIVDFQQQYDFSKKV